MKNLLKFGLCSLILLPGLAAAQTGGVDTNIDSLIRQMCVDQNKTDAELKERDELLKERYGFHLHLDPLPCSASGITRISFGLGENLRVRIPGTVDLPRCLDCDKDNAMMRLPFRFAGQAIEVSYWIIPTKTSDGKFSANVQDVKILNDDGQKKLDVSAIEEFFKSRRYEPAKIIATRQTVAYEERRIIGNFPVTTLGPVDRFLDRYTPEKIKAIF